MEQGAGFYVCPGVLTRLVDEAQQTKSKCQGSKIRVIDLIKRLRKR